MTPRLCSRLPRTLSLCVVLSSALTMVGCETPGAVGTAASAAQSQVRTLTTEGSRLANQDKLDQAIETLSKAAALSPDLAAQENTFSWLGYCHMRKGNAQQALAAFDRHLRGHPQDAEGFLLRGDIYYRPLENFAQAAADYTRAIELSPSPLAYARRGMAYVELKRWDEAIADLIRFLDAPGGGNLGPMLWDWRASAYWCRGLAYLSEGKVEAAKADALRVRDMMPRRALEFSAENILDLLDKDKRTKVSAEALEAGTKAEAEGSLWAAFQMYQKAYGWGMVPDKVSDKSLEGMMRLYPKLTTRPIVPEEVRRFAVQADTAAAEQSYDQAVTLYGRAVEAAPWWPKGRYNSAMLKAQKNDFAGAITEMQTYLTLSPNAPDAREAQDAVYQWQYKQQSAAKK